MTASNGTNADDTHPYQAVLFDLDGVLLEDPATPAEVYQQAADMAIEQFQVTVTDDQRRTLQQYHYNDAMAACCRELGVDPATFWAERERMACQVSNRALADGARKPYPDTDVLEAIPVELAIVSNNRDGTVTYVADHLFDVEFAVATGREGTVDGYERKKPDSYYLEQTLETLAVDSALYVGDRESDIIAANGANIDSAFVRRDHNSRMTLETTPTYDIEGLEGLREVLGLPTA